jgi:hypothetical protein
MLTTSVGQTVLPRVLLMYFEVNAVKITGRSMLLIRHLEVITLQETDTRFI